MTALTRPRDPLIDTAIALGRLWCTGQIIDGSPALGHAFKVARKLDQHYPTAPAELIAAVIVHDAPFFAPPGTDLDATLTTLLSADVARAVRAIEAEHRALDHSAAPTIDTTSPDVLIASAADKVVSIGAILRRARASRTPSLFWDARRPFLARVPYFQAFAAASDPHLPVGLARELNALVTLAADATAPHRTAPHRPAVSAERGNARSILIAGRQSR
jgi:hypothetical protein